MLRFLAGVCLAFCFTGSAYGQLIGYTTRLGVSGFDAAISGFPISEVLDFDLLTPGSNIASGDQLVAGGIGTTFTYSFGGVEIMVSDVFDTTSPFNFLGTDDGGNAFQDGDDFTLTFDAPINALGLYFITAEAMVLDDIVLLVDGNPVPVVGLDPGVVDVALGDGGNAYSLGVVNPSGSFTTVDIVTVGLGAFTYNVDDIIIAQVPEPSSLALAAIAFGGALVWRWRRSQAALAACAK